MCLEFAITVASTNGRLTLPRTRGAFFKLDMTMTKEQAINALKFIQRATLGAMEIPAFQEVVGALQELANPKPDKDEGGEGE